MDNPNTHCVSNPANWPSQLRRLLLGYFTFELLRGSVIVFQYVSLAPHIRTQTISSTNRIRFIIDNKRGKNENTI